MKKLARLGCVVLMLVEIAACKGAPMMGEAHAQGAVVPLSIKTSTTVRKFRVEVARSEAEQARGLMFRESLPDDGGMIFPMTPPRNASFWMKNTVIPLDMIFIRADGSIARIAAQTVPYSLEPVDSGEPVAAVLELAGGKAAALGIAEDDVVSWDDN
jgi:uncharacterized membrane protein (UPF0127 family)